MQSSRSYLPDKIGSDHESQRFGEDFLGGFDACADLDTVSLLQQVEFQRPDDCERVARIDVTHVPDADDLTFQIILTSGDAHPVLAVHGLSQLGFVHAAGPTFSLVFTYPAEVRHVGLGGVIATV